MNAQAAVNTSKNSFLVELKNLSFLCNVCLIGRFAPCNLLCKSERALPFTKTVLLSSSEKDSFAVGFEAGFRNSGSAFRSSGSSDALFELVVFGFLKVSSSLGSSLIILDLAPG